MPRSEPSENLSERFHQLAEVITHGVGTPWAMLVAALIIVLWAVTGPIFAFSDTWQLVINTGTTIITFLMVFAIQNAQNRDAKATHIKLDELIRATRGARNQRMLAEQEDEEEMDREEEEYASEARTSGTHEPASASKSRATSRRAAPAQRAARGGTQRQRRATRDGP